MPLGVVATFIKGDAIVCAYLSAYGVYKILLRARAGVRVCAYVLCLNGGHGVCLSFCPSFRVHLIIPYTRAFVNRKCEKKFTQICGDVFVHNDERESVAGLVKIGNSGNLNEL